MDDCGWNWWPCLILYPTNRGISSSYHHGLSASEWSWDVMTLVSSLEIELLIDCHNPAGTKSHRPNCTWSVQFISTQQESPQITTPKLQPLAGESHWKAMRRYPTMDLCIQQWERRSVPVCTQSCTTNPLKECRNTSWYIPIAVSLSSCSINQPNNQLVNRWYTVTNRE